jgi:membrane fusion protein (multidrug efflux system)
MNANTINVGYREHTTHLMAKRRARSGEEREKQLCAVLVLCLSIAGLAATGCASSHAAIKLPDTVNAEIRPQVSGYIIKQDYQEGSFVHKGQVLFEIDPRPFQATLDRTKGELAQAEADLAKSTINVNRDTPLAEKKAVSKEKLDNEIQEKLAAEAAVASSKASVERAELDLGWTKVTSLVDGVAGITEVQMGNLVSSNSRLTSVSQVNLIKVHFRISEQEYLRAKRVSSNEEPMQLFENAPELILADDTVYPHKGKILLTDHQVDTNTGKIRMVAAFPNPGNILRPGQYGRVRIETGTRKKALLVPQSAVKEIQGGYEIALVGPDNKAIIRPVKAGEKVGTMWVIQDGLKPDDRVITEGIGKVKDGTAVVPKADTAQEGGR